MSTRQLEFEVEQLPDPWRSAINALARSGSTGAEVIHCPRVPPEDGARMIREARDHLCALLRSAGVL